MADDVTKKDLQGVEGRLTKQIGEVKKLVEEERKSRLADTDELNKIMVNIKKGLDDRVNGVEAKIKELENAINSHAKLITELQNKKTSLF